jgi:hypothetical protein
VYYSGHAVYRELENYLQLTATMSPALSRGFVKDAHANWNKAEDILLSSDVDADVLAILDTCYSSNVTKGAKTGLQNMRKFELLSAAAFDHTTAAPGVNSFTRSLIRSLRALLRDQKGKPFSTLELNTQICMDPRRHETPSFLWNRLPNDQHIFLAPMSIPDSHGTKPASLPQAQSRLNLSLELRDPHLSEQQVRYLATTLTKALGDNKKLGICGITWRGIRPMASNMFSRAAFAMLALVQWKRRVRRRRDETIMMM